MENVLLEYLASKYQCSWILVTLYQLIKIAKIS